MMTLQLQNTRKFDNGEKMTDNVIEVKSLLKNMEILLQ